MKTKILMILMPFLLVISFETSAQTAAKSEVIKPKTVLLINAHFTYPGWSEGKLNKAFFDEARKFFQSQSYKVLETKIEDGYNADEEVEKHL
jgi:modulator of drug activity B